MALDVFISPNFITSVAILRLHRPWVDTKVPKHRRLKDIYSTLTHDSSVNNIVVEHVTVHPNRTRSAHIPHHEKSCMRHPTVSF